MFHNIKVIHIVRYTENVHQVHDTYRGTVLQGKTYKCKLIHHQHRET